VKQREISFPGQLLDKKSKGVLCSSYSMGIEIYWKGILAEFSLKYIVSGFPTILLGGVECGNHCFIG
jgi:hypothetical protein